MSKVLMGLLVALLVALAAIGWVAHSRGESLDLKTAEALQLSSDLSQERQFAAATSAVLSARVVSSGQIKTVTQEIIREVYVRIPADLPALPPAWRVLHDSAAAGQVPPPTTGADGAPVAPQAAADTVTSNYGICRDNADKLDKLQSWIDGVTK